MSRVKVEQLTCDLCGYGGPFSRLEDFWSLGDVDLCRWCSEGPARAGSTTACGKHELTFGEDTWTCSCGEHYRWPWTVSGRVLNVVPSIVRATANGHVQETWR
jgi:hypothetical protein